MKNSHLTQSRSIFTLWIFTISGIIGIAIPKSSDWFLSLTPLNLFIVFIVLLINIKELKKDVLLALIIPFTIGFLAEALGVNYGLVFGKYTYGENLGYKAFGVPLIICANWTVLTAISSDIAKRITTNTIFIAIIGSVIMTLLDLIIEVSAPRFDFWEFEDGVAPLQNYIGWLVTGFFAQLGYTIFIKVKTDIVISYHILFSTIVFFGIFLVL